MDGKDAQWYSEMTPIDQHRVDDVIDTMIEAIKVQRLYLGPVQFRGETVAGILVEMDAPEEFADAVAVAPLCLIIPHRWDDEIRSGEEASANYLGTVPANPDAIARIREEQA